MHVVEAVFENGAFRPASPVSLPEGARVRLSIEKTRDEDAEMLTTEQRRGIRRQVVERMRRNPLPEDAPQFRRDDIYDRG
jgi:predicted DNA-binding antitoxin AbrB/MazE fold protein